MNSRAHTHTHTHRLTNIHTYTHTHTCMSDTVTKFKPIRIRRDDPSSWDDGWPSLANEG